MPKYLVETISIFRHRYAVEADNEADAVAEVDLNVTEYISGWEELSQVHLAETIVTHREVTEEEILKIFDEDNDYLQNMSKDVKLKHINKVKSKE